MYDFPAESGKEVSFPPDPRAWQLSDRKPGFAVARFGFLGRRKFPALDF
jgi:hypothetical protein